MLAALLVLSKCLSFHYGFRSISWDCVEFKLEMTRKGYMIQSRSQDPNSPLPAVGKLAYLTVVKGRRVLGTRIDPF